MGAKVTKGRFTFFNIALLTGHWMGLHIPGHSYQVIITWRGLWHLYNRWKQGNLGEKENITPTPSSSRDPTPSLNGYFPLFTGVFPSFSALNWFPYVYWIHKEPWYLSAEVINLINQRNWIWAYTHPLPCWCWWRKPLLPDWPSNPSPILAQHFPSHTYIGHNFPHFYFPPFSLNK